MTKQPEWHTGTYTRIIVYKEVLGEIWLLNKTLNKKLKKIGLCTQLTTHERKREEENNC